MSGVRWPDIPHHGGEAQGGLPIPVIGENDADGRVREQVDEERLARERTRRNTPKRHDWRWNDVAQTPNRLGLEPNRHA